jgi:hypothetical protein
MYDLTMYFIEHRGGSKMRTHIDGRLWRVLPAKRKHHRINFPCSGARWQRMELLKETVAKLVLYRADKVIK